MLAGLALLVAVLPPAVQAETRTWKGAANGNWFITYMDPEVRPGVP